MSGTQFHKLADHILNWDGIDEGINRIQAVTEKQISLVCSHFKRLKISKDESREVMDFLMHRRNDLSDILNQNHLFLRISTTACARGTTVKTEYLVARYTADVVRAEPRNIGIIVWCPGGCTTRFIATKSQKFIQDKKNFQRWVNHWQRLASQNVIQVYREPKVDNSSSEFLKQIGLVKGGGFELAVGGSVHDAKHIDQLGEIADFLFHRLVATPKGGAFKRRLTDAFNNVVSKAGLKDSPYYLPRYVLPIHENQDEPEFELEFDAAVTAPDGEVRALLQTVSLNRSDSVNSFAFKAGQRKLANQTRNARVCALYYEENGSTYPSRNLKIASKYGTPVNLADQDAAASTLRRIAA